MDEWNYPGVMALDRQGRLVVVYGYHLAALDAATGEVVQVGTRAQGVEWGAEGGRHTAGRQGGG